MQVIHKHILDTLFPIHCLGCQAEGVWLCPTCENKIQFQTEQKCGVCERVISPTGRTCLKCLKKSPLDGLVVAGSYQQNIIAHAVHLYKYRFVEDLHVPLGNILNKILQKNDLPVPELIIPVPLHPKRLRWRGFNQSALLAKELSQNLLPQMEIPLDTTTLSRCKYTEPQMGLKEYAARQQNIRDAFQVTAPNNIKNKTILLVDDIATTGSTLSECARVLKKAGAQEIWAVVIARQETGS